MRASRWMVGVFLGVTLCLGLFLGGSSVGAKAKYQLRNYKPKVGDSYTVTRRHYERWYSTLANGKSVMTIRADVRLKYRETILAVRDGAISHRRRTYQKCWYRLYHYTMKDGVIKKERRRCVYHNKTVEIDGFGDLAGISVGGKPLYGAGVFLIQNELKAIARARNGFHMYIPRRGLKEGERWKISVLGWMLSHRIPHHIFDLRKAYFRGKLRRVFSKRFGKKRYKLATIRLRGKFPFDLFPGHRRVRGVMRLSLDGDVNRRKDIPLGDVVGRNSLKFSGMMYVGQGEQWATMRVRVRSRVSIRP